ncbi:STAS domain-containing protein [Kitasatospora sp. SolWspMP-SS2h]|uniref:STAS domain-containing protein n=1 Tax=Kitasatospora sp. SolWspMP-SS2h TaxID=1305729 RepID=UPI00351A76A4
MGEVLLAVVPAALDDKAVMVLQKELAHRIVDTVARGVVIDISGLDFVDTFIAGRLSALATAAALLGARPVLTGMRPAVAQTLVHLGVELHGIAGARDLETGLALLHSPGTRIPAAG